MTNKLPALIILLLLSCLMQAQAIYQDANKGKSPASAETENSLPPIPTPSVGVGTGMMSFYGDLYTKHFQAPMVSRLAYDLNVSQPVNNFLQFNFYVLFGKLGANERLVGNNRNLNFESQIRAGGVNLQYNFDHFLPAKRTATPYVSLGIESFEFLSKTDMKDKNGNTYYYWSDGSTRNKPQNAPDASTAIELQRDYTYETDIRESNLDGFGKYPERSFAVPVGAGAIFKLNDFLNFKIGATMHFTFTDYIDGVTAKSVGDRKGNSQNDKFMMSSFALQYNFGTKPKKKTKKSKKDMEKYYDNIDFLALENDDFDKDGVIDFKDKCGSTPIGAKVDAEGCPLDDDHDGVPNYKDDELHSKRGAIVTTRGVELTPALILRQFQEFNDTTGMFATVENFDADEIKAGQKVYSVKLGSFKKGLPPELMTKFLSIGDVASAPTENGETIYTAGEYSTYEAAQQRKQELAKQGIENSGLVYKLNNKYYDATEETKGTVAQTNTEKVGVIDGRFVGPDNQTPLANSKVKVVNSKGEVLQTGTTDKFGAFHFNYLPADQYVMIELDEDDPQLKKLKKVFLTSTDQNQQPREVYPGKISYNLAEKTAAVASNGGNKGTNNTNKGEAIDTKGVVLRIQLGAYHKPISKNVFKGNNDLIEVKTEDGLYKYMVGSYTSFDAAAKRKVEMITNGYPGAFIAAYKDGKRITLKEAGAIFDQKANVQETDENAAVSGANKNLVRFKVQVGVFKNDPPDSKLAIFVNLKDLTGEKTKSGLTKYVVGNFKTYKEAEAFKAELASKYGLTDAFVVALFDNEYISTQEALELMK